MRTLDYPKALQAAGINVVLLDGWETAHSGGSYVWRTGDPTASMWHHTASSGYTPNRDKANAWAGLLAESGRLYQSGGGVPSIVIANAYPGPITSGYGQQSVHDLALNDLRNDELARGADDSPGWAGNRSYWNTEVVLDGVGTYIDDAVWAMLVTSANVLHDLMGWSVYRAIGHAQHTSRKIDLRDGRWPSAKETMIMLREDMATTGGGEVDLERWATRLRNPIDFDRMEDVGIITSAERDYWVGVDTASEEMQDLRDAVTVRSEFWAGRV